ncbi:MAG: hypothetical protein AB2A00_39550 [Myxococcota bacterium]
MTTSHAAPRLLALLLPLALMGNTCPTSTPDPPDASTSSSGGGGCRLSPLGDPSQPMEMEVVALQPSGTSVPLHDGDDVSLIFPPQGGRVIFLGVRATNIDPCAARLSGSVKDLTTGQVRVDVRTVNLKDLGGGFGGSSDSNIATFANVPMCPNQWASTAVYDQPFQLEVSLRERNTGREKKVQMNVTPRCNEPGMEEECLCICKDDYVLGETCEPDGGVGDGGSLDAATGDAARGDGG